MRLCKFLVIIFFLIPFSEPLYGGKLNPIYTGFFLENEPKNKTSGILSLDNYDEWFKQSFPYSSDTPLGKSISVESFLESDFRVVIKKIQETGSSSTWRGNKEADFLGATLYKFFEQNPTSSRYFEFKKTLYDPAFFVSLVDMDRDEYKFKTGETLHSFVSREAWAAHQAIFYGIFSLDKEIVMKSLVYEGVFRKLDAKWKRDRDIVYFSVRKHGGSILFAHPDFKDDKDLVLIAAKTAGSEALNFASDRLRDDRDVVMAAVNSPGFDGNKGRFSSFKRVSKRLRADKEIALAAVYGDAHNLEFLNLDLRDDKEVVRKALSSKKWYGKYGSVVRAFRFASDRLRDDEGMVKLILGIYPGNSSYWGLHWASERLKDNKPFVREAIKINVNHLKYASKRLRDDKELALFSIKATTRWAHHYDLSIFSERLRDDEDVVRAFIKMYPSSLKYASKRLQKKLGKKD